MGLQDKLENPESQSADHLDWVQHELDIISNAGLKRFRKALNFCPDGSIVYRKKKLVNFASSDYLAFSKHPAVIHSARKAILSYGVGAGASPLVSGYTQLHRSLEREIAQWEGFDDALVFSSGFSVNLGTISALVHPKDLILSDALNHASIIDGVRLCKAERFRYENNNMADLEARLKDTAHCRNRIIVTDSVFSMDGTIAQLDKIVELADKYNALIMVDECHSSGFMGKTGRGTHEHCGVMGKIDIITGTFGKALGGAMGGFTSGKKEIIEILRQKSRPYLFSNSLAPSIVGASIAVLDMLTETTTLRDTLWNNTQYFRKQMTDAGFDIKPGEHPIVPIMLYDAKLSQDFACKLLDEGVYVKGFYFPVVPKGQARIRVQLSAGHTQVHLDKAIAAFIKVGKELGVIK